MAYSVGRVVGAGGLVFAIAAPDGKGDAVGGGVLYSVSTILVAIREAIRTGIAIQTVLAEEVALRMSLVGGTGDGIATILGVGVAVGVEGFDGVIYGHSARCRWLDDRPQLKPVRHPRRLMMGANTICPHRFAFVKSR